MRLGRILKEWRESKQLGLRTVAKQMGISHGTLRNFERGEEIDARTLIKILWWLLS